MPVDSRHPLYEKRLTEWEIMEACIGGEIAVKERGAAFLPRLSEQTDEEYNAYKARAQFFNGTGRTAQSLVGFCFRKDPETESGAEFEALQRDVTLTGLTWYDYVKTTLQSVITHGRFGTLIDWSEAEKRPFCIGYSAASILNWGTKRINGRVQLSFLTLREYDPEFFDLGDGAKEPDKYEPKAHEQFRVFELRTDGEGSEPYVFCSVFRKKKKQANKAADADEFVLVKTSIPTRRGVGLDAIPFVFHGAQNQHCDPGLIPLLDLALVNLSLYRTSADLENGRHVAGIPTPWAAGFGSNDAQLKLGASVAWVTDNPQAKCGFLEFQGGGLTTLENAVTEKKSEMAALGARMLEPEAKKAEAFATVEMRSAGESSALMGITVAVSASLSEVVKWFEWWIGTADSRAEFEGESFVEINTEFSAGILKSAELTALFNGYLGGAIDFETLFWNLQRGEIVPADADAETMRERIANNPPGLSGGEKNEA